MAFFGEVLQKAFELAPRLKKRTFDPEAMSIDDISLPLAIDTYDLSLLWDFIKDEIKTFNSLGYKDATLENLKAQEYHSLQIGLMLKFIEMDKTQPIEKIEQLLPAFVLGATKKQLHIKVFDIVYRYDMGVAKDGSIESLQKEIKWTPLEAAYLLRYISLEDRRITK